MTWSHDDRRLCAEEGRGRDEIARPYFRRVGSVHQGRLRWDDHA